MSMEYRPELSFYSEVAALSAEHGVSLVRDMRTGRLLVKKVMRVYNAEVYRGLMKHPVPHTPQIVEVYEEYGVLTVIEEYIEGRSLETILEMQHTIPEETVYLYMQALCDILTELHGRMPPIIHRDIKPSNILITPQGELVLLDFNAARLRRGGKSEDTEFIGTRGFAAPEQYGFGESGEQADIYAAGALMKVLLTGSLTPDVPLGGNAELIVRKCMKMDPSERYPSAAALKDALQAAARRQQGWRRYLPPGFRTGRPGRMLGMGAVYAIIFYYAFTTKFASAPQGFLLFEQCCICAGILLMVFFAGNYLGVLDRLKIRRIRPVFLRVAVIIAGCVLLFLFAAFFTALIEKLLGASRV